MAPRLHFSLRLSEKCSESFLTGGHGSLLSEYRKFVFKSFNDVEPVG